MYMGVRLLEHAMKMVENVLEKRLRTIVTIDDMRFGSMCQVKVQLMQSLF